MLLHLKKLNGMTWQGTCIRKSWFWKVFGMRSHCFSFCRLYHSNVNSWIKLVEDIDKHAVAEFNTIGITLSVEVFLSKAWVLAFVILWCAKWVKSVLIGVFEILQVTFESTSPQEGAFFLDQKDGDWRKQGDTLQLEKWRKCVKNFSRS